MNEPKKTVLYWAPRVISILFALFISLFGFDVFSMGIGFPEIILAFFMDMLPAILVAVMVIIAWRWELVGSILCAGLAIFYLVMTWGRMGWDSYVTISGSLFVLAVLWFFAWRQKKKAHRAE